jgi:hypothetical protein
VPTYAELHAKARELLDHLDRLDLDALPADAQAQLRRRREELEALLAATALDTAPLLVSDPGYSSQEIAHKTHLSFCYPPNCATGRFAGAAALSVPRVTRPATFG